MMEMLAGFVLFTGSAAGYILYFTQKYRLRAEFAPALFCAWTSSLLFAGGLLNILPEMAGLIFGGGYVFLAAAVKRRFYFAKRERIVLAVFLFVFLFFMCVMYGSHFTSYDNFSHWATVVKDMLLENRLPNFEDEVIRFQAYPPGSSLFLYYFCRVTGTADHCMLLAQLFMLLSFLLCMAVFVRNKTGALAFCIYTVWALTANNSIYELRVDTLLPLTAAAAFAVVFYYKDTPRKAVYSACGLFILLVNIKNSGIFFYAVCMLFCAAYLRSGSRKQNLRLCLVSLAGPLFAVYLWKKHVAFAFPAGMESKHAMSMENYGHVFAGKTKDDIVQIGLKILRRFLEPDSIEVKMMIVITIVLLLAYVLFRNSPQGKKVLHILAAGWGCMAAYTVSLYAMYLFSMPLSESMRLASYSRYILSVILFIYGISITVLLDCADSSWQGKYITGISAALAMLFLLALPVFWRWPRLQQLYQKPDFAKTKRAELQEMMKRDGIKTGDSCFLYCGGSDDDARYLFYLTRYELWTGEVLSVSKDKFEEYRQQISAYDYFVVWDMDEQIMRYLKECGYAQYHDSGRMAIRTEDLAE